LDAIYVQIVSKWNYGMDATMTLKGTVIVHKSPLAGFYAVDARIMPKCLHWSGLTKNR